MTTYTNVLLKILTAQLGVDFTHVLFEFLGSICTQHNQHVDLFRIEKRIPLVTHVIGLRKNTLTNKFGRQCHYLSARRGGHAQTPGDHPSPMIPESPRLPVEYAAAASVRLLVVGTIAKLFQEHQVHWIQKIWIIDFDLLFWPWPWSAPPLRRGGFFGQLAHVIVRGSPGKLSSSTCSQNICLFVCLFACLFAVIRAENSYFASLSKLEVNPLRVYPLGPRSSSCSPTKGTPPPGDALRADWGSHSTNWRVGSVPGLTQAPHWHILSHQIASQDPPRLIPLSNNTQDSLIP